MASHLEIASNISFDLMNQLIKTNVKDVALDEKLTLHAISLGEEDKKIKAVVNVSGVYDGDIYVTFLPRFDKEKDFMFLEGLELKLASKSLFAKSANWMANKVFGNKIDEKFEEILNQQVRQAKTEWVEKLKHFEFSPGMFVQLQSVEIDIANPKIYSEGISCTLVIDGELFVQG